MTAALRFLALAMLVLPAFMTCAGTTDLSPDTLGIVFDLNDPNSRGTARLYASLRNVPPQNLVGIRLPAIDSLSPDAFAPLRSEALDHLPTAVQSLLLVWSRPFAVGCMSITTAFAAGYRPDFCEPGCGLTSLNPLYDSDDWLPPDTVGWWPAMLLPTDDPELARRVIERGINADRVSVPGTFYLVTTSDVARNVRSADYTSVQLLFGHRIRVQQLAEPVREDIHDAIGYFTGGAHIQEIARIGFLPGAAADHLTSTGGILYGGNQMSALSWLKQGATGLTVPFPSRVITPKSFRGRAFSSITTCTARPCWRLIGRASPCRVRVFSSATRWRGPSDESLPWSLECNRTRVSK